MNEWILIALVMISEAFLHYFPWMKLLKGKKLPLMQDVVTAKAQALSAVDRLMQ